MANVLSRTFTLGRYTCVERIGVTPVGEQWRAKRFGLIGVDRQYLLTKLNPQLAKDAAAVAKLTAALSSYTELDYDGLLRFFEQSSQGSDAYVIFEFVGYADLRKLKAGLDLLGGGDRASLLLPAIVVALGQELSAALARAHERGLYHGLITPQSVWLDAQGGVHLADVGLGPVLPAASWATDPTIKAIYPYMAPELQISGTPNAQSDVYALGMVLQELLGSLSVSTATAEAAPVLSALTPVLLQATARVASGRFGTMAAMQQALQSVPLPLPDAVRSVLQQIGQQFQLAGDMVPQAVIISDRSSAEPLPPPPTGRVVVGKPNLTGPAVRGRLTPPAVKLPASDDSTLNSSPAGSARTASDSAAGGVVRPEEDTPLPMSRPLLLTNPRIPVVAVSPGERRAPTGPVAKSGPPSGQRPTEGGDKATVTSGVRTRSGIDWLTSQSSPDHAQPKVSTRPELPTLGPRTTAGPTASKSGPQGTVEPQSAAGRTPANRRGGNTVTVNPKAQLAAGRGPAASATTPTEELQDEVAAASGIAAREELKWTPEVVASTPEKTAGTGTYAHLVTSPVAASSIDELSIGETNPSLAPIRINLPMAKPPVGSEEPTNQLSTSEAVAIAESERLAAETSSGSRIPASAVPGTASDPLPPPRVSEPFLDPPGSLSAAMLSTSDMMADGSGIRQQVAAPPRKRTALLLALGFLGLLGGSAVTYLATRPSGHNGVAGVVDAGAGHPDGQSGDSASVVKVAPGELRLSSEPAADVFVDGTARGRTPVVLQLPPGPHKLLLIAEEYQLLRKEITAGAALALKLERAKLPDEVAGEQVVKVKCKSKGELRILVDGNDTGLSCPTETLSLAPGKYRFGFLRPATEELQEKQQKVKKGKSATKMKVKF